LRFRRLVSTGETCWRESLTVGPERRRHPIGDGTLNGVTRLQKVQAKPSFAGRAVYGALTGGLFGAFLSVSSLLGPAPADVSALGSKLRIAGILIGAGIVIGSAVGPFLSVASRSRTVAGLLGFAAGSIVMSLLVSGTSYDKGTGAMIGHAAVGGVVGFFVAIGIKKEMDSINNEVKE